MSDLSAPSSADVATGFPSLVDKDERDAQFEELGVSLNLPFGTWTDEVPNPEEDRLPDMLNRLEDIQRTDGHARALYRLLTLPLRMANWSMVPAEGGEDEADFCELMLTRPPHEGGMSTSFDYIRARMAKAVVTGFQTFEKVYDIADVPGYGESLVLKKLAPRDPDTVSFLSDENGGFNGIVQRAYKKGVGFVEVEIPKEKAFFFTVDKEDHPFYGRSMFLPSLYHFDKKHKLYYLAHIAMQFAAVPGRLGYLDTDDLTPTQKTELRNALANFGFSTAMLVPKGIRIEPFQGSSGVGQELVELINHHNIQASQSVLAQFIDLSVGTSTGSRSLSEDFSTMFLLTLESILSSMAEHWTWYILPQFIDWNFGTGRYPTLKFDPISDELRAYMHDVFTELATATTTNTSPDFIWELEKQASEELGLPIDYDALEKEREEEMAKGADVLTAIESALAAAPPDAPDAPAGPEDQDVAELSEASNRQRLAEFAEVNELGSGAGGDGQEAFSKIVADIQTRLTTSGHQADADGVYGAQTAGAVKEFQALNGLPETGKVDLATYALLLEAAP